MKKILFSLLLLPTLLFGSIINVSTPAELNSAFNTSVSWDTIKIASGIYSFTTYLLPRATNLFITAADVNNKPVIIRKGNIVRIERNGLVFDNIIFDADWGTEPALSIRSCNNIKIQNCEIRYVIHNGIQARNCSNIYINNCEIHHCLSGTYTNPVDAHGIAGYAVVGLYVDRCNIHHLSGDCIQIDPLANQVANNPRWDTLVVTNCKLWTSPLDKDYSTFKAGEEPGENAIDTKTNYDADTGTYRPYVYIKNVEAYGFIRSTYINNRAAFNLKQNINATLENVIVHDCDAGFRIRGRHHATFPSNNGLGVWYGNANVTAINCIFYNNDRNILWDWNPVNTKLYNCVFDVKVWVEDQYNSNHNTHTYITHKDFWTAINVPLSELKADIKNCIFRDSLPNEVDIANKNYIYTSNDVNNSYIPNESVDFIGKGIYIESAKYDFNGKLRINGDVDCGAYQVIKTPVVPPTPPIPTPCTCPCHWEWVCD